jgi:hypothetical protein
VTGTLAAVMGGTALGTVIYMVLVVAWVELRTPAGRHRCTTTRHTTGRATATPAEVQPTPSHPTNPRKDR